MWDLGKQAVGFVFVRLTKLLNAALSGFLQAFDNSHGIVCKILQVPIDRQYFCSLSQGGGKLLDLPVYLFVSWVCPRMEYHPIYFDLYNIYNIEKNDDTYTR